MKNCNHQLHKTCISDALICDKDGTDEDRQNQNKCKMCEKVILDGLEEALK